MTMGDLDSDLDRAARAIEPAQARAIRVAVKRFKTCSSPLTVADLSALAAVSIDTARYALEGLHRQGGLNVTRGRGPKPDQYFLAAP